MEWAALPIFAGITPSELPALLRALDATEKHYEKNETILAEGHPTERMGIVLRGRALIEHGDAWGNRTILGSAEAGAVFAEVYACAPGEPLLIAVTAAEPTAVLFLNLHRAALHPQLLRNLLAVCAQKSLALSRRMLHTAPKSIRGRLMSYFSECACKSGSRSFVLSFNRQQLADYLGVDRSAMCSALSAMQRDGLIAYRGRKFTVCGDSPARER